MGLGARASLTTLAGKPSDSWRRFEFPLRFWRFLSSEMSRSEDGPQEGESREDNQGSPIKGAAGTVTPAMLEQLESRLVEKIVVQLAAQGDPKGATDTSASAKKGEPGAAAHCGVISAEGKTGMWGGHSGPIVHDSSLDCQCGLPAPVESDIGSV